MLGMGDDIQLVGAIPQWSEQSAADPRGLLDHLVGAREQRRGDVQT
jgi:hypothetical protein